MSTPTLKTTLTSLNSALDTIVRDTQNVHPSMIDLIVHNEQVLDYVGSVIKRMYSVYKAGTNEPIVFDTLESESSDTCSGHVLSSRIDEVVTCGNLREKMTLLMTFKSKPADVFLWNLLNTNTAEIPPDVNQHTLTRHKNRMALLTGIRDIPVYRRIHSIDATSHLPYLMQDGPVLMSRSLAFSNPPLRSERPADERMALRLKVKNIKPPLSYREIEFIEKKTGNRLEDFVPWITGRMYWKINENHFYAKLADEFGHEVIAGPSSSTETALMLMELFNGFDVKLATLACVGWMCPCQHHSLFEIFLAALPYGLNYDTTQSTHTFLWSLIHESLHKTSHAGTIPTGRIPASMI